MSLGNSPQWMYSSGAASFYDHEIDGSLRFNDNDSARLTRTPASASNRRTWTWSAWVKRGNLSGNQTIWSAGPNNGFPLNSLFWTDDKIDFYVDPSATATRIRTSALYRDPSAWYHIVAVCDTTQSSSSERLKLYVNGVRVTDLSINNPPAQNSEAAVNNTVPHWYGAYAYNQGVNQLDSYIAEVNFVDGQALDADDFGETKSGVWIPKEYSGSYGTNGYHLEFAGNANDSSGNGNNFTANNISSHDYVPDSPTQNFCTWNSVSQANITLSNGNLQTYCYVTGSRQTTTSTLGVTSGKWYAECSVVSSDFSGHAFAIGVVINRLKAAGSLNAFGDANIAVLYGELGQLYRNGNQGNKITWPVGSILQIAVDVDAQKIWFGVNGTWYNSGNPASGTNPTASSLGSGTYEFFTDDGASQQTNTAVTNFGQDSSFVGNKTAQGNTDDNGFGDFYYTPPSGYLALCTANLTVAEGVDPAEDNSPQDYFNTVLYTGNSSSQSITGVGFQPDMLWFKSRSASENHALFDSVRPFQAALRPNSTLAEYSNADTDDLASVDSDGFSLNGNGGTLNESPKTYVAWNWKANGSGVSNTDGSITSTVSANTDAGFSIVSYTGNGDASATIGHSLGATPQWVVVKCRNTGSTYWTVYHSAISSGTNKFIELNVASAQQTGNFFGATQTFNSSVFSVGYPEVASNSTNVDGRTYIAYCWAEVEGFSKFGSYTGNGSTNGPFVYTGFRPAFVIIKQTNGTTNWISMNNKSSPYNVIDKWINTNLSNAEGTSSASNVDFLSNGFKMRNSNVDRNGSGGTFIYMAFAENPFKYANAR